MARAQRKMTKKDLREDPLMTKIAEAQSWYELHGTKLIIAIAVIAIAFIGYTVTTNMKVSANEEALVSLSRARQLMSEDRMDEATSLIEENIDRFKGTQGAAESMYSLAEYKLQEGLSEEALVLYQTFEKKYNREFLLAEAALSGQGAALENLERYAEAAAVYQKLAKKDSFGHLVPVATYNAGRCWKLDGNLDEARKAWDLFVADYSNSSAAKDAQRELSLLDLEK